MDTLGNLINKFLHQKELWQGYCRYWIIANWGILVGEKIAQVSEARAINGDLIRVTVRDAIWSYHLCLLKPRIIQKIKSIFPDIAIRDIYFQIGEITKKENPPGKREYKPDGADVKADLGGEKFRRKIRILREQCAALPEK